MTNEKHPKQARYFIGLAITFTRYISAYMFRDEFNSPDGIRAYALALLNHATSLNKDLIDGRELSNWKDILSGATIRHNGNIECGPNTCTGILYNDMRTYVDGLDHQTKENILMFIPPSWK